MKPSPLTILLLGATLAGAPAQTLLFGDNFDAPDTANFDGAPLDGRLTGTLAAEVQMRSSRVQHDIQGMQLRMLDARTGRIRFHEQQNLANWYDWAAGTTGSDILNAGGFRIEFDWTPPDNTADQWVSVPAAYRSLRTLWHPAAHHSLRFLWHPAAHRSLRILWQPAAHRSLRTLWLTAAHR